MSFDICFSVFYRDICFELLFAHIRGRDDIGLNDRHVDFVGQHIGQLLASAGTIDTSTKRTVGVALSIVNVAQDLSDLCMCAAGAASREGKYCRIIDLVLFG